MTLTHTFKKTNTEDLDITGGKITMLKGTESLAQRVRTRLKTFRGECFLSPETGMPWITGIFAAGTPTKSSLNAAVISSLDSVAGIKEMGTINYEVDKPLRLLTILPSILAENDETLQLEIGAPI